MRAQRPEAVAAVPESLEALHLVAFQEPQALIAHRLTRSPQTWQRSPQGQAAGEVALLVG